VYVEGEALVLAHAAMRENLFKIASKSGYEVLAD